MTKVLKDFVDREDRVSAKPQLNKFVRLIRVVYGF